MPLVSWPFEYKADAIAAQYVGKEQMVSALMKLADKNNIDMNRDSYTHPSISKRVARLNRLTFYILTGLVAGVGFEPTTFGSRD